MSILRPVIRTCAVAAIRGTTWAEDCASVARKGKRAAHNEIMGFIELALTHREDVCLLWPFGQLPSRPIVKINGTRQYVHRFICEKINGPAPSSKHGALHNCGLGAQGCCAPKHIYWGTQKDNVADALRHGTFVLPEDKGVRARGKDCARTRLSEQQVRKIRKLSGKYTQRALAAQFGVSRGTIRCIQDGTSWGWLR